MLKFERFTLTPALSLEGRGSQSSPSRANLHFTVFALSLLIAIPAFANPPVAKYIFPAGGQRGTTVQTRVGGCFFHGDAGFEMLGAGIEAPGRIRQIDTIWFESPLIPQPASQQAEDYPKDYGCTIKIAKDAELGSRAWRAWTSQGATSALPFVIGDLPEVIEQETQGVSAPVEVKMPVTINGRIFPRENVDAWAFHATAGQQITCDASAKRIGSPLDAELQLFDPAGKPVVAQCVRIDGDPRLHFTAAVDGMYQIRIHDVAYGGLQNYVYRLTVSAAPFVDYVYPLRGEVVQKDRRANPIGVAPDDLPEVLEVEPNDKPTDVKPVTIPAALNGRIDHPGDVDYWAIEAKKSQIVEMDVWASRLGSRLDSVLSVEDANGKQLARNDDRSPGQPDSRLTFKAPSDGIYYIRIEDRFVSRGGKEFAYRLYVYSSPPDFRLTLGADAITLPRLVDPSAEIPEKRPAPPVTLKVDVERLGGFDGAINLIFDGLPEGIAVNNAVIPARQLSTQVKLTAAPHAKIAVSHLRVHGTADIAGGAVTRSALFPAPRLAPMDDVLLAVAMVTPFKEIGVYEHPFVPCGSIFHRRYALDRGGFHGPITVSLADRQIRHLQGVWGPTVVIPDDADSFDYWMRLACEMELGRTSRAVMALTAVVKDFDGSEHVVSFSSGEPNDQFVSVATAPLINVGLDQSSLLASPAHTAGLTVHVQRAKALLNQIVKVELILPPGGNDILADPLTLDAGQTQGILHIHFGRHPIASTIQATIQASVPGPADPSLAQVHVEFVPESATGRSPS